MAGKDIVRMSQKELKRIHVIGKAIERVLTQAEAGEMLSLSERQIRRIVQRIREEGNEGIVHRGRGRESNRRLSVEVKEKVIGLYREKYQGFGPTLATEKLEELDGIVVSDETLRQWLIEAGLWKKGRRRREHRQWRQRKERCGEMVQIDGSHHDWFEGRGPVCVLMGYIDDATGRVHGRFYEYEGTIPAMDSFMRYIRQYGIPGSVYLDKHTTYKSPAKPTIEEEFNGIEPLSEFGRALTELGVRLIHAHSPQAKGRVERLFKTFQDRVVKEMRLKGVSTIEEANSFLENYLPEYNARFAVAPYQQEDLHRPLPQGIELNRILCIRTERTVRNDDTIAHDRRLYQLEEALKGKKVIVEELIDGTMRILCRDRVIHNHPIEVRPEKPAKQQKTPRRRQPSPPADHPWRKPLFGKGFPRKQPPGQGAEAPV
ncbi:MAG: ISNCY family transposase [Nitrospirales bacterium]|nr:ISNCY family transposase [Nitrospirales bacterium]